MQLALSILVVLASLGILIHAYFGAIRPYDIMLQSIKLLPRLLRDKPLLLIPAIASALLVPMSLPLAAALTSNGILRTTIAILLQAGLTVLMALIAVRIHTWIVKRDKARWLRFGPVERRMALVILGVWAVVLVIGALPGFAAALSLPRLVVRLIEVVSGPLSWLVVVLLALAGPAASFQDPHPYRRAIASAKGNFTAIAAIVMLSRGLFTLSMIAVVSLVQLMGITSVGLLLVLPFVFAAVIGTFLVSEIAIAIALTRCWENTFDADTRGRDYNADWT